jgi:hypothetical protein
MRNIRWMVCAGALVAGAARGDVVDPIASQSADGMVTVLQRSARDCPGKGKVCVASGGASTVEVAAGEPVPRKAPLRSFKRAAPVAAHGPRTTQAAVDAWALAIDAQLDRPAVAGNAVFAFYDLADPHSVENREVTAVTQANVPAGRALSLRARLSPDDGFHAGHTYRVQVVQILGGRELVLARGDFALE